MASNLSDKSEMSLLAATTLQNNSLFSSVVHCAYYSCFQLMKYVMITKDGYTNESLDAAIRNSTTTHGVHVFTINYFKTKLKSEGKDWRSFSDQIESLKKLRLNADYLDHIIDSSKSQESISTAKRVNLILKSLK